MSDLPPTPRPEPSAGAPRRPVPRLSLGQGALLLAALSAALAGAVAYALQEALPAAAGAWGAPLSAAGGMLLVMLPLAALLLRLSRQVAQHGADRSNGLSDATGAATRLFFLSLAEREWARARRYGGQSALLIVDVDRYPRLVQARGAAAGDAVLRELARHTAPTLRGADALARFGDAQLAVFLAHADATGALDVAERIRERCEQMAVPWQPQPLRLTVSVGVAQLLPAHPSLRAVLDDAQAAAEAARQAGGNCVRAAPALKDPSPRGSPRNDQRLRPQ